MDLLNLQKNDILDLNKVVETLTSVDVGLGWDTRMDLDTIAFLLDDNDKVKQTVYFSNKNGQGVRLNGDNLTGEGDGDDEIITVNFNQLPSDIKKIALYANIFSFTGLFKKDFSDVKGAYIRLVDNTTSKELCKYSLTENGKGFNAFHFADLVDNGNGWSFVAVGEGCNGSVKKLKQRYR